MADFSESALDKVQTKDLGEVGKLLTNLTVELKSFDASEEKKVFGFFNELSVTYGYSQGKTSTGKGQDLVGTYNVVNKLQIGATPGLTAFVTNNLAVEVSVDVLGLDFQWINQTTNQVEKGSFRKSSADFKINIFSVNIGLCTYF